MVCYRRWPSFTPERKTSSFSWSIIQAPPPPPYQDSSHKWESLSGRFRAGTNLTVCIEHQPISPPKWYLFVYPEKNMLSNYKVGTSWGKWKELILPYNVGLKLLETISSIIKSLSHPASFLQPVVCLKSSVFPAWMFTFHWEYRGKYHLCPHLFGFDA